jgi:hypothetical protein
MDQMIRWGVEVAAPNTPQVSHETRGNPPIQLDCRCPIRSHVLHNYCNSLPAFANHFQVDRHFGEINLGSTVTGNMK